MTLDEILRAAGYVPAIPSTLPAGWSIGPNGEPIAPGGGVPQAGASPVAYVTGATLPLVSMAAGALLGRLVGKKRGEANLGTAIGAAVGYVWHPLG